jgi:hypothetical protein
MATNMRRSQRLKRKREPLPISPSSTSPTATPASPLLGLPDELILNIAGHFSLNLPGGHASLIRFSETNSRISSIVLEKLVERPMVASHELVDPLLLPSNKAASLVRVFLNHPHLRSKVKALGFTRSANKLADAELMESCKPIIAGSPTSQREQANWVANLQNGSDLALFAVLFQILTGTPNLAVCHSFDLKYWITESWDSSNGYRSKIFARYLSNVTSLNLSYSYSHLKCTYNTLRLFTHNSGGQALLTDALNLIDCLDFTSLLHIVIQAKHFRHAKLPSTLQTRVIDRFSSGDAGYSNLNENVNDSVRALLLARQQQQQSSAALELELPNLRIIGFQKLCEHHSTDEREINKLRELGQQVGVEMRVGDFIRGNNLIAEGWIEE